LGLINYPIRLTGVPVSEFEALLSVVFPSEKLYDFQQPRHEDALRAAERWDSNLLREATIRRIRASRKSGLNSARLLYLDRRFRI
jgi:hypothetical protein